MIPHPPPAPVLTASEMAIGAFIMGLILLIVVASAGEVVTHFNRGLGRLIVVASLPLSGLFALTAFAIMVTG